MEKNKYIDVKEIKLKKLSENKFHDRKKDRT